MTTATTHETGPDTRQTPAMPLDLARAPRQDTPLNIALAVVVWVVFTAMLAMVPRMTGDTFMALAGAEDLVQGRMGQPDQWSFITTDSQVWINQNWGANLILYGFHQLFGGEFGIVVMKFVLVTILSVALLAASRLRGASWTITLLVAAVTLSAVRHYVDMRANLYTLTFVPVLLYTLYWSGRAIHRIWLPVVVLILWSHIHAAWVFGFGMLGLWGLCQLGARAVHGEGRDGQWKRWWPYVAAPPVFLLVSALTSPHGVSNITYTFESMFASGSEVWHLVDEWQGIFDENAVFGSPAEFGVQALLMFALAATWLVRQATRTRLPAASADVQPPSPVEPHAERPSARGAAVVFEVSLWLVAAVMAVSARRFIPLPLLVGAPLLARGMTGLLGSARSAWVVAVAAAVALLLALTGGYGAIADMLGLAAAEATRIAQTFQQYLAAYRPIALGTLVLIVGALAAAALLQRIHPRKNHWPIFALSLILLAAAAPEFLRLRSFYHPDNPYMHKHTLFQRMITWDNFPGRLARFINTNDIHGNVYNDWRWESFLRWYCGDNVKVYLGGRAQTVYTAEQYEKWRDLQRSVQPRDDQPPRLYASYYLPRIGANLMAKPTRYNNLVKELCYSEYAEWVPIYFDGEDWLCAYAGSETSRRYIQAMLKGELTYPNEEIAALSRGVGIAARMTGASPQAKLQALAKAAQAIPSPFVYHLYSLTAQRSQASTGQVMQFLEDEAVRLSHIDFRRSGGSRVMSGRLFLTSLLAQSYENVNIRIAGYWAARHNQLQQAWERASFGLDVELPEPIPEGGAQAAIDGGSA